MVKPLSFLYFPPKIIFGFILGLRDTFSLVLDHTKHVIYDFSLICVGLKSSLGSVDCSSKFCTTISVVYHTNRIKILLCVIFTLLVFKPVEYTPSPISPIEIESRSELHVVSNMTSCCTMNVLLLYLARRTGSQF